MPSLTLPLYGISEQTQALYRGTLKMEVVIRIIPQIFRILTTIHVCPRITQGRACCTFGSQLTNEPLRRCAGYNVTI